MGHLTSDRRGFELYYFELFFYEVVSSCSCGFELYYFELFFYLVVLVLVLVLVGRWPALAGLVDVAQLNFHVVAGPVRIAAGWHVASSIEVTVCRSLLSFFGK